MNRARKIIEFIRHDLNDPKFWTPRNTERIRNDPEGKEKVNEPVLIRWGSPRDDQGNKL